MAEPQLTESEWGRLDLSDTEAAGLASLGKRLAAVSSAELDSDDPEPHSAVTVIECQKRVDGDWYVRVRECVGVIGVNGRSWVVRPKVPMKHLLWLLERADSIPRLDSKSVALAEGEDLWQLLATWFVSATEVVVRNGLANGYEPVEQTLPYLRGSQQLTAFARSYLRGRLSVRSRFDDFTPDNALNRTLRAALLGLVSGPALPTDLARRVRRLLNHFPEVGELRVSDLRARAERHTSYYAVALKLAQELLRRTYRDLASGSGRGWAFLLRTPEPVEQAIRSMLATALEHTVQVKKTARQGAGLAYNPDLVFGDLAVGDIKYSLDLGGWRRSDVYQLLAFAAVFDVRYSLLVNFAAAAEVVGQLTAETGGVHLSKLSWPCQLDPAEASDEFCKAAARWYETVRVPRVVLTRSTK